MKRSENVDADKPEKIYSDKNPTLPSIDRTGGAMKKSVIILNAR